MAQQTFSGVPGDFSPGEVLTAADMDKLREFILFIIKDGDETDTGETSPIILDLQNDLVTFASRILIGATSSTSADHEIEIHNGSTKARYYAHGTGTGYTHSDIRLDATGSTRGAGMYTFNDDMAGGGEDVTWFTGSPWNGADNWIVSRASSTAFAEGAANVGIAFLKVTNAGNLVVSGSLSKGSGSFDIPHPVKGGDWRLRHSFIEGPQADNIYRGTVTITGGSVEVDLDTVSNMTPGTWEALNTNPWSMVASSGNAVEWSLSGKTLTITGPDASVCNWLVIGERHDEHMKNTSDLSDSSGKIITEYEAEVPDETHLPEGE